jgi:hypothetical protein
MQRVKLDIIRPMNGAEVAAFVRRMTDLPDAVKARYKAIVLEK